MTSKIIVLAGSAYGIAFAASASAMPLASLRSHHSSDQVREVRMICDEYGSCWRQTTSGQDIARGVIRGLEGRSIYRHRDRDHYRRGHRDWDRDYYDDED
jgi:hypothetical protein